MIIDRPSPNFNRRRGGAKPDLIVLHGTAGRSDEGDLSWLTSKDSGVSYHYLIGRSGSIYRLVNDEHRAWHAGKSEWEGRSDCNTYSIGIGLSNDGEEPFTDAQYESLGHLLDLLTTRHMIPLDRIVGHYHVSPGRKTDPWYHFHWSRAFAEMGA